MKILPYIIAFLLGFPTVTAALPVLTVPQGGTGGSTWPVGDCLIGNGTSALTSGSCGSGSTGPATSTNPLMATYVVATSTTLASRFPSLTSTNATTTHLDISSLLTFNAVTGNSWDDFCTSITGGSGLCDGNDATGAAWAFTPSTYSGVVNQSTTTPLWLKNTQIIASTTNFTNASTTFLTVASTTVFDALTNSKVRIASTMSCTTTNGSANVTGCNSTSGLTVGQIVRGPGIPASTTVASAITSTGFTMSAVADSGAGAGLVTASNPFFSNLDGGSPPIWRLNGRLFVGNAVGTSDARNGTQYNWCPTTTECSNWAPRESDLAVMSTRGTMAITGMSRASDGVGLISQAPIGVSGFVVLDKANTTGWGGYFEAQRDSNANYNAYGLEVDAKNKSTDATMTPYIRYAGAFGIWLAAGGDDTAGGAPTNPSNAAMAIVHNDHTWNTGIVFEDDGLTNTDGSENDTGEGVALMMAKQHAINWMRPSDFKGAYIKSTVGSSGAGGGILFTNDYTQITNASNTIVNAVFGGSKAGIATSSPNNVLDLYSATKSALGFQTNSGVSSWTIGQDASDGYKFKISSSTDLGTDDRLVIDGAGRVGINTANPGESLYIIPYTSGSGIDVRESDNGFDAVRLEGSGAQGAIKVYVNGTQTAQIAGSSGTASYFNNGNIGFSTTSSAWPIAAASLTKPQLALTDTTSTNNAWTLRSINNSLYIATSTYTATSSVPAVTINPNGLVTFGLNAATCAALTGSSALCDGSDDGGAGGGAWPFTPSTYGGVANQSTTTPLWLNGTQLIASSTLVVNATTTGSQYFSGITSALLGTDNNGKLVATTSVDVGYINRAVANTRAITIAGTANQITSSAGAQDLSSDRTWTLSLPSLVVFPVAATSTRLSCYGPCYFGGSATSSFSDAGVLTLATDLAVSEGGTGASTLTGLLQGNGTGAITGITNSSTVGQVLRVTGASTYAWGALDLADTDAVTGILPIANGGTNASSLASHMLTSFDGTRIVSTSSPTVAVVFATSTTATSTFAGSIGVGTTSPWGRLAITGKGTGSGPSFVVANANNLTRFLIQDNGNVGINTVAPSAQLQLTRAGNTFPASSGSTQSAGLLVRLGGDGGTVLDIGGNSTLGNWLQSTLSSNLATNYPLILNPNGGAVTVGTTTAQSGALTVGHATQPQLLLSDNTGSSNLGFIRWIANTLYIGTSTPTATSTPPALSIDMSKSGGSLSIGSSSPTFAAANGLLTLGGNGGSTASSTISMQKLQFDGYDVGGTRRCIFVNAAGALTVGAGACTQ